MAVLSAKDTLKERPSEAIDFFEKLLPDVKNEVVERAIRIQMVDLYKANNEPEKALDEMRQLILTTPAVADVPSPATPAPAGN
jgi:preprotein translocase subunit SecA